MATKMQGSGKSIGAAMSKEAKPRPRSHPGINTAEIVRSKVEHELAKREKSSKWKAAHPKQAAALEKFRALRKGETRKRIPGTPGKKEEIENSKLPVITYQECKDAGMCGRQSDGGGDYAFWIKNKGRGRGGDNDIDMAQYNTEWKDGFDLVKQEVVQIFMFKVREDYPNAVYDENENQIYVETPGTPEQVITYDAAGNIMET